MKLPALDFADQLARMERNQIPIARLFEESVKKARPDVRVW